MFCHYIYLWEAAVGLIVGRSVATQASPGHQENVEWRQKTLHRKCYGAPLCNIWTNTLVRGNEWRREWEVGRTFISAQSELEQAS